MATREEIAEALAAREAATARMAQAARPPGGRWEGPATTLPQNVLSAPFRAAAGFTQAAIDRAAEEQPLQAMQGPQATRLGGPSLTPRSLQASTDYEPRRVGAELGAETAMNVVGLPALTGGVPAGAVGSAARRDPNLWHDLSRVKLPKPVSEMQATHVPTQAIKEKTISPAQLEGGWLLPAVGDRTSIGSNLMGFNGFNFTNPVAMQGGHGFMAAQADKGLAWASNPGVITRISNKVKKLGAEGDPVYFPYTAMHNEGGDFSHHVSDTLSEAVKLSKVTQKAEREFNRAMKADHIDFGAVKNWPGVKADDLREYLIKAPGDVRNKFAKVMDTAKFQELGFPSVAEARHAVTDPRLLDAPRGSAGLSISKMDPTGKAIPGASGHRTYSTDIAGDYIGGLARQIPRDVFYPDIVKGYEKLGSDPNLFMALGRTGAPIAQKATPQWVDSVSKWMEQNPRAGMKYSNFTDRKTGAVMGSVAAMDEVRGNEGLAYLLAPRSKAPAIGTEVGKYNPNGISEFAVQNAPEGYRANRLLYSKDGQIVGGMQVTKTPGGAPVVANTYVHPDFRRQGIATQLNQHAESLYGPLERSEGPSEVGQAFRESLTKRRDDPSFGSNFTDRPTGAVMGGLAAMDEVRPPGIKAWHASPHDFDKFDLSKLGTGQGAASYGPGIYAAESPKVSGVGGEYWKEFAGKMHRDYWDATSERLALEYLMNHQGDRKAAIETLKIDMVGEKPGRYTDALQILQSDKQIGPRAYELNIKADPKSFLQWDEPLSAQPQIVGKLNKAGWDLPPKLHDLTYLRQKVAESGPDSWYADQLRSVEGIGQKTGAEFKPNTVEDMTRLRDAGIPGIRYADAASRSPGVAKSYYDALKRAQVSGNAEDIALAQSRIKREMENAPRTYNYVLNNPDIIEIMRKLAVPGVVGAGAMGELVRQDRQ